MLFYRYFCRLTFYCFIVCFLAFYRLFLSSVRSTNYWVIWVNLVGWGRAGGSVRIWLHGLCIRCTCCYWSVSVHVYPDLMLLSCFGWPYLMPNFPFIYPPSQIVEIFTTSTIPSSRHFPIYAQIPLRLPSSVSQRFLQTKLTQSRN